MKTKSIMLIAVSLGFGLIAAIGMSQVLGQKSEDNAPEVEMVQVYVASRPLDIGEELKLDENLNVKKRPIHDVPENAIRSAEELDNMIAKQKIPKDVLIVSDFIVDKHVASLGKQPPEGYRAFTIRTNLEDTLHNSITAGDRVDLVGVFRSRTPDGEETRVPNTFLKNIEVWQVNDKDYIGVDDESKEKISTITVLLTPKQVEAAILAQDIASIVRVVKTNRNAGESDAEDFDLASLTGMNNSKNPEDQQPQADLNPPQMENPGKSQSQLLIDQLNAAAKAEPKVEKVEYTHKMVIYKGGGEVIKYGFTEGNAIPKVIEQSITSDGQTPVGNLLQKDTDLNGNTEPAKDSESKENESNEDNFPQF